jgi:hypothetical protein
MRLRRSNRVETQPIVSLIALGKDKAQYLSACCLLLPVSHRTCGFHRLRRSTFGHAPWRSMKHPFPLRWHAQQRFLRAASHCANMHESASRAQLARALGPLFALDLSTLYSHRLGACASRPHPDVRGFPTRRLLCPIRLLSRALGFRMGLPPPPAHSPSHPLRRLPCSLGRLRQDAGGGVWSTASSALCGSPVVPPGRPGGPVSPSTKRDGNFVLAVQEGT